MTPTLHLPRPRRPRLPGLLHGGMPRLGKDVNARPLSMWDPVYLGRDLYGDPVYITLAYRNLLLGGLPDAGKSNGVAQVLGHAALCCDVALWLFDGKETDLAFWEPLADRVIGHSLDDALTAVAELQALLDARLGMVKAAGLEKINRESGHGFVLVVVDELALYTSVYGEPAQQKRFSAALRDLVSRGRAAGVIVVAATQRPSSDIVPTSLRDLFGYRWALASANDASSDIVLGDGYANAGYSAATINPDDHGVGYLLADNRRTPRLFKSAYLPPDDIRYVVSVARGGRGLPTMHAYTGTDPAGGESQ